jgi:hypothetical protein
MGTGRRWRVVTAYGLLIAALLGMAGYCLTRILPRPLRASVPLEALPDILPTQAEMEALVPCMAPVRTRDHTASALEASPGYLWGKEQEWACGVEIMVAAWDSKAALLRAVDDWAMFNQLPLHRVWIDPIGERCFYQPQGYWSIEFVSGNVYAIVSTRPGCEALAREVARLLDGKIRKAASKP